MHPSNGQSRRALKLLSMGIIALTLSGCSFFTRAPVPEEPAPGMTEESSIPAVQDETKNVSYRGLLSAAGPSVTMEGTHILTLSDGRTLGLESASVTLSDYAGKEVEVRGDVRPAVEGGGLIMRVTQVVDLSPPQAISSVSGDQDAAVSSVSSLSSSVLVSSSSSSSSKKPLPLPLAVSSSVASVAASSSQAPEVGDAVKVTTAQMAKAKIDPASWTQQYCTGHIGFCIPIQKNWWYKSFGAGVGVLWYVELSSKEIQSKGEGPIVVSLLSGDAGPEDGKVFPQGETVLGVHGWTGNRHFEIRAPAELRAAVEYILLHITPYSDSSTSS